MAVSRVSKSIKNIRVSVVYYFVFLFLSFFSRKAFLDCLGPDFVGLSGTLANILGFLSLAEMGVGQAVCYHLYKPLEDNDKSRIADLVSVMGYLYRRIGIFILLSAIVVSLFIPIIFKGSNFQFKLIYFAFYTILSSSLFSYFINYRQILLVADQREYEVTIYLQGTLFLKVVLQMLVAYYLRSYYFWLILEIVYGLVSCIVLNFRIKKIYPWLDASVIKGKTVYNQYTHITTFTKQVFVHKIKDFILNQSDQILIFAFVSLRMVACYGNYTLIISRVFNVFSSAFNSISASVGNLVAENDMVKIRSVFEELIAARFVVAGILVFSIYNLIDPLIKIWLGEEYLLSKSTVILLIINSFIMITRGAVDSLNAAYGHFADTWSAWVEGLLNIAITLVSAPFIGLNGILLGKIVSLMVIVVLWKPYYLFHDGFKVSVWFYWRNVIRYYAVAIVCIFLGTCVFRSIPLDESLSFGHWASKAVITIIPFIIIYVVTLYYVTSGMRILSMRFFSFVKNKINRK